MITVLLDGERLEIEKGSLLKDIIPDHDPACSVAVIRPGTRESEKTRSYQVVTTAGEVVVEATPDGTSIFEDTSLVPGQKIHWHDRYAAAFGTFEGSFDPARVPFLYDRGDVILGCGGYDPKRSYLIFSKMHHTSDFGAGPGGGVIGRVVGGRGVLDRWSSGDEITGIRPVMAWADTSRSFMTNDRDLQLEDGIQIVTHMRITSQGYSPSLISTGTAKSVEHLLLALSDGRFVVGRSTSTHIMDRRKAENNVSEDLVRARREGRVTLRTKGRDRGSVYIYTTDVPASPAHTVVGQVTHGIELARLAKEKDIFCVQPEPRRFDLVGMTLDDALATARDHGVSAEYSGDGSSVVVVAQEPATTLECLAQRQVKLSTLPYEKVIDITLDDTAAPVTCDIFRRVTGLNLHDVGKMPFFFNFEDVYLFKPNIPTGVKIIPENIPAKKTGSAALAVTNDSRKGTGTVGVRLSESDEFGPTSEPFEGTNIIGRVIDTEKLKSLKEKEMVFFREVGHE
jgi:putative methanogenesis marker protein 3